jgi:hypothetical protein
MVIGELKIECVERVKNSRFYGDYEVRNLFIRTIINERYDELVSPQNGIVIKFKTMDGDKVTFTIDRHYYTGEVEKRADVDTIFSTSFGFGGCIYEVSVDINGNLVSLDEWFGRGSFEDGNEPDNHYTAKSRGIKWELIDR